MINYFDVSKAMLDYLRANTALDVFTQGAQYEQSTLGTHLREMFMPSVVDKGIGKNASDKLTAIYQIDVLTPISQGKWANLNICDTIMALYPNGRQAGINRNDMVITVNSCELSPMLKTDTHIMYAIRVNIGVIG